MKWIDYRAALGIGFSDSDKANMLSNKIVILFDELSSTRIPNEGDVCRRYFSDIGENNPSSHFACYAVRNSIVKNEDIRGLISHTIAFSNAAKRIIVEPLGEYVFQKLVVFLEELNIDYEVKTDSEGCFIFPKGARELDEGNVNTPFEWLREFPTARKAMEKALRAYSNMESASQVADLFRKALETFSQEFFDKPSSLENLKSAFGQYLKDKGVPRELASNFETTLQMYTNYMNGYAKHHDKTERRFLEFIMYQTGNIIRFIISLSNE